LPAAIMPLRVILAACILLPGPGGEFAVRFVTSLWVNSKSSVIVMLVSTSFIPPPDLRVIFLKLFVPLNSINSGPLVSNDMPEALVLMASFM